MSVEVNEGQIIVLICRNVSQDYVYAMRQKRYTRSKYLKWLYYEIAVLFYVRCTLIIQRRSIDFFVLEK